MICGKKSVIGPLIKLLKPESFTFAGLVAPKRAIFSGLQCNVEQTEQGAVAPKRAICLKFGSSSLCLHHSWDCLIENVINVLCAFQWGYFPFPELLDAIYKFLFVACLHFGL